MVFSPLIRVSVRIFVVGILFIRMIDRILEDKMCQMKNCIAWKQYASSSSGISDTNVSQIMSSLRTRWDSALIDCFFREDGCDM